MDVSKPPHKTIVYVDAFNLYYAIKGHRAKWLDLSKLLAKLLTENEIVGIKYFTARVKSRQDDPQVNIRQEMYFRALKTIPNLEIILGHFLQSTPFMMPANYKGKNPKPIQVIKTEEKGSDVNLATHLLVDGFKGRYDVAAVLSNDSDLCLPIKMVKTELHKTVGVICPHPYPSKELIKVAGFFKKIDPSILKECLFPNELIDTFGKKFRKPESW